MATPENTLISRAEVTSLLTPATGRVRLTLDGATAELGSTGWRDMSASLDPAKVGTISSGMLVVIRSGNIVTIKFNLTPTASGNVQVTASGMSLGSAFAPDTILWVDGRGGTVGISTSGVLYVNPAVSGQKVDATLTFVVDNTWPTTLPGVELGQPVVV